MNLKLFLSYGLSFFILVFLLHEAHDWAHALVSRCVCGCWGLRAFDYWVECKDCIAGPYWKSLAWIAGPLVNYGVMWSGWKALRQSNPLAIRSLGFSLVFAALPFQRIMGALAGGGDETFFLRMLFLHSDGSNRRMIAIAGLAIVLILSLPPLVRAFLALRGWLPKVILFPIFLILPGYVDRWVVSLGLNDLLAKGFLSREILPGTPLLVIVWLLLLLIGYRLTRKYLRELPMDRLTPSVP